MKNVKNKGRLNVIILLSFMAAGIALLGGVFFRYNVKKSTDTFSSLLGSEEEKIEFYKEYVLCPTDISDIEFHIVYEDHSKDFFPSASNYEIASVFRVDRQKTDEWLGGFAEADENEFRAEWWEGLDVDGISVESKPRYYKAERGGGYQVVYFDEGVIKQYFYFWEE